MKLLDPRTGRVVWDAADPYAGPMPPAPAGADWVVLGEMGAIPEQPSRGLDYYLGGTGIPERLNALNEIFNPVVAMGQSMQASQNMLAPETSGWGRVEAAGNMLSGMAGFLAPMVAAKAGGKPAAAAIEETFLPFWADESGAMTLPGGRKGFTAYHGSPHDFDRFSMDKIGTGEGAQAYGHGLYFAEAEDVAREYRDALGGVEYKIDGETVWRTGPEGRGGLDTPTAEATSFILRAKEGGKDPVDLVRSVAKQMPQYYPRGTAEIEAEIARLSGKPIAAKSSGRLYEVRINADPEDFLDWDRPLSEQSAKVRDAIKRTAFNVGVAKPSGPSRLPGDRARGPDFLDVVRHPEAAAEMARHGIPGIKYLDAGSRGAGDGSRNFVVFDENLIEIVRKYGIAGAAAMLGVTAADVEAAMAGQQ